MSFLSQWTINENRLLGESIKGIRCIFCEGPEAKIQVSHWEVIFETVGFEAGPAQMPSCLLFTLSDVGSLISSET